MKKLLLSFVVCISFSSVAYADEDQCSDLQSLSEQAPEPEMIEHNGVRGMFFPMATSRYMLCQITQLRALQELNSLQERELTLTQEQLRLTEHQLEIAQTNINSLGALLDDMSVAVQRVEGEQNVWYRSPYLWLCVGAVLTVGLYFAAAYSLQAI